MLAGTALAATAATLTTATYAWYVTNNKVEATNVSGATAGDQVAGSLLISAVDTESAAGLPLGYTNSIDLTSDVSATALNPQTFAEYAKTSDTAIVASKEYYTFAADTYTKVTTPNVADIATYYEKDVWADADGKAIASPNFVTFSFWLTASDNMNNVKITTTFANTASTAVAANKRQTLYKGMGLPTGKKVNDTYAVDAVYALRMEVTEQNYDVTIGGTAEARDKTADAKTANGEAVKTIAGVVENHNATHAQADAYASPVLGGDTPTAIFDSPTGDANKYYFGVMGREAFGTGLSTTDGTSPDAPETTWATLNLAKNVDKLVTIKIWLEGTDANCWDSCVGQNFTLNLEFAKAGA